MDKIENTEDIFLTKKEIDSLKLFHQQHTTNETNLAIFNKRSGSSFDFSM